MGVRAPAAYGPAMSYSEKYRGTEWGQPVEPGPTAPQPSQSGGGGRFMVVILGLVVVAGLVGLGAFIFSQSEGPNRPVYGARRTAAPTIDRAPLIASFVELTKRPDLTFHLQFEGTIQAGGFWMTIATETDVAGKDQAGTMRFEVAQDKAASEYVLKDGVIYAREVGGRWQKGNIPRSQLPEDPLESIAGGATLEYMSPERREGREVHRLRSRDWQLNDVQEIAASQGLRLRVIDTRFDVWVSDAGVPEEARFTAHVRIGTEQREIRMTMRGSYTFSGFGEPITIKAPKV
jgi:hypothetical protein